MYWYEKALWLMHYDSTIYIEQLLIYAYCGYPGKLWIADHRSSLTKIPCNRKLHVEAEQPNYTSLPCVYQPYRTKLLHEARHYVWRHNSRNKPCQLATKKSWMHCGQHHNWFRSLESGEWFTKNDLQWLLHCSRYFCMHRYFGKSESISGN